MSIKAAAAQSVDEALKGLNFVDAIIKLAQDPRTSVESLRNNLIEAHSISQERAREAEEAAKTISVAKEMSSQLEKDRQEHAERVSNDDKRLEERRQGLIAAKDQLNADHNKFLQEVEAAHVLLGQREKAINDSHEQAEAKHKQADARKNKLDALEARLAEWEKNLTAAQKKHDDKIAADKSKRKKIAAALKEAEQEE